MSELVALSGVIDILPVSSAVTGTAGGGPPAGPTAGAAPGLVRASSTLASDSASGRLRGRDVEQGDEPFVEVPFAYWVRQYYGVQPLVYRQGRLGVPLGPPYADPP